MAGLHQVTLVIGDVIDPQTNQPMRTTCLGNGTPWGYPLVGRTTTDVLRNKILTDPSNKIAANHLNIGGTTQQIGGTLTEGATLQYLDGSLVFEQPGKSKKDKNNAIFGGDAGINLTTGAGWALFGDGAGKIATTGDLNTCIGLNSGDVIVDGSSNTLLGADTNIANGSINGSVGVGRGAIPQTSGEFALGSVGTPINTLATAVAGAGAAPPATVEGYIYVRLNGTLRAIPYYNPTP